MSVAVYEAIRQRHSIRAYLDKPVARETIEAILDTARWAPSGVNTQPWQVCVVQGDTKRQLGDTIIKARDSSQKENPDYQYYPREWVSPYKDRRKACGLALYQALDIGREDRDKQKAAWYRNYRFFDAPVGLLFLIDARLEKGSWLDMGMFIQNVMIAAKGLGLDTCPQASLAEYPDIVRQQLDLPTDLQVVCGMALGYADPDHPINQYRLERLAVDEFTRWYK
ncbi:nitroreductase [Thiohalophilus sp.]|uniref:nitroreductase n=1 Tax=Thiohalophilus sp. TaxID=3028392 RepID=UPI002ACE8018|nr:nitroreductase [Thiohalophilus sp.]MDZ7662696.1 nitroreductase [Thiohalophilus sp.]